MGAALACTQLSPDLDSVIALEIVLPDSGFFDVGDTLQPRARALNGRGDSVAAEVSWAAIDTVLDVDSATGATFAGQPAEGRIQARVGNLRSAPVTVIAQPLLDSIEAVGDTVDTVTVSGMPRDTLSDSLVIQVFADTTFLTRARALFRRRVRFDSVEVFPPGGATITLVPNDTGFTNAFGIVAVRVRLGAGTPPDSVKVWARAVQRDGSVVPGSPKTFVVEFQ